MFGYKPMTPRQRRQMYIEEPTRLYDGFDRDDPTDPRREHIFRIEQILNDAIDEYEATCLGGPVEFDPDVAYPGYDLDDCPMGQRVLVHVTQWAERRRERVAAGLPVGLDVTDDDKYRLPQHEEILACMLMIPMSDTYEEITQQLEGTEGFNLIFPRRFP